MKKVGIIVAMRKEWDILFSPHGGGEAELMKGKTQNGTALYSILSGVGKVNAAIAAYRLIKEKHVTSILSFGCAGGLAVDANVGEVIVGDKYCYYDVDQGEPNKLGQVEGCPRFFNSEGKGWRFLNDRRRGLIVTGDAFVRGTIVADAINSAFYPDVRPLAVDMESAAVAQVCDKYGIGYTSVRVISDNPVMGTKMPDDFWENGAVGLSNVFNGFWAME